MRQIPLSWIQHYVDQLLDAAKHLDPGPMQDAVLRRADAVMDLVKAWIEHERKGDTEQ